MICITKRCLRLMASKADKSREREATAQVITSEHYTQKALFSSGVKHVANESSCDLMLIKLLGFL